MIFAENNNDIYSEKLDRVVQKTDFNSNLKHNSQNVYSIFNSFISLNFSKKVFEVIHFIKFLTEKNIQIWDVSIYNFNQIKKKFLFKDSFTDQLIINLEEYKFVLQQKRIPNYLIIIDFIEEFIGIDKLIELQEKIRLSKNEKDLKSLINEINRDLYQEISSNNSNSQAKRIGESLFKNVIEIVKQKKEKFDKNSINNREILEFISFTDIDDDMILDLWKIYSNDKAEINIKSYKKIFKEVITLVEAIFINSTNLKNVVLSLHKEEGVRRTLLDVKEKEIFLNDIFEETICSSIQSEIDFCLNLNDKKINLLKKNEIDILDNIKNFNYHLSHLKLSFYRSLIFSGFQNKIIEAERRGNITEVFNSIQKFKDDNLYKTQNINIEQIKNNCELVIKIFFLKLWEKEDYNTLGIIEEFLNVNEKLIYKDLLNNIRKKPQEFKIQSIEKIFINIRKNILEDESNQFESFKNFLKSSKKIKASYRRQGIRESDTEISSKFILEIIDQFTRLRKFLYEFLNQNNDEKIFDKFVNDFYFFNDAFKNIHKIGI